QEEMYVAIIPSGISISRVVTTVSFAAMPVSVATANSQLPNPNGTNSGAISLPIDANMLWSVVTILKRQLKLCNSHRAIDAVRITVPAFARKDFPLSHICLSTLDGEGIR